MMPWLRMHAQALGASLRRFSAQPLAALASIAVLAVAIALPVLAAIALRSAGAITSGLETEPHVNVYLALDAGDDDAKRVEQALRSHADAAAVRFVPRSQALEELKSTTHLAELLASLDRNPLPHAFTVRVRTIDAARIEAARAAWLKLPKVDQVIADFEWAERLGAWVRFADRLLAMVALVLAAAVAFIVGHLIRLQVLSQREEIEVSQLIGATAADVRRPFLYHGLLQGAMAGLLALALSAALGAWVGAELRALTPSYASEFKIVSLTIPEAVGITLMAAALGLAGAWWAVGRELRAFATGRGNPRAD
jgi:cell division transport system permease protein